MEKKAQIPWFLPMANKMVKSLMRLGVKLTGPGKCPMYLLTVPGRKSGQPRTTPIAVVEQDGKRYLLTPYGVVDWVRNLRAAGEGTFTRGRHPEQMQAMELSEDEGRIVLKRFVATGNPIVRLFGITKETTPEDIDRMASGHPVFLLKNATPSIAAAA